DCLTLKRLIFFGSQGPTARGLAHFAKLVNMEMFQIRREDEPRDAPLLDEGLGHLTGMKKLTSLNLHAQRSTDACLVHLGKLKSLKELYISAGALSEAGLVHLEGLTDLEQLTLYGSRISDVAFKAFRAKMPKLK